MQTLQNPLAALPNRTTNAPSANSANYAANSELPDPFEDAPELPTQTQTQADETPILTATQIQWFGVLSRLGVAFPNSRYAAMGRDGIIETARLWADELKPIPAEAVREVYSRTMNTWTSDFPPHSANFRAAWLDPAWDFWAQQNQSEDAKSPVFGILPEPAPSQDGPGATSARRQNAIWRARGAFVVCECQNEFGIAETAILGHSGAFWECAAALCRFRWPVEDEMNAPIPARRVTKKPLAEPTKAPRVAAQSSWLHEFVKACELNPDAMSAEEFAAFTAWAKWFRGKYECPPSFDLMQETWPQWQEETADANAD